MICKKNSTLTHLNSPFTYGKEKKKVGKEKKKAVCSSLKIFYG